MHDCCMYTSLYCNIFKPISLSRWAELYGMFIIFKHVHNRFAIIFFGQATTSVACSSPRCLITIKRTQIELPHWGPLVDYQSGPLAKLRQTLQISCAPELCSYAYRLTTDKAEFTTDSSQHSNTWVGKGCLYASRLWGHGWCSGHCSYEYRYHYYYFFQTHTGTWKHTTNASTHSHTHN